MTYPDLHMYPLVDLINKEIYALDDYRAKTKLAARRSRVRRVKLTMMLAAQLLWMITVLVWVNELQLLTLIPLVLATTIFTLDIERYNLKQLKHQADRAKSAYEISLECTIGGSNASEY